MSKKGENRTTTEEDIQASQMITSNREYYSMRSTTSFLSLSENKLDISQFGKSFHHYTRLHQISRFLSSQHSIQINIQSMIWSDLNSSSHIWHIHIHALTHIQRIDFCEKKEKKSKIIKNLMGQRQKQSSSIWAKHLDKVMTYYSIGYYYYYYYYYCSCHFQ